MGFKRYIELESQSTSLIWTLKREREVSILERCPYWRGHCDDVTFKSPLTVWSVLKLRPKMSVLCLFESKLIEFIVLLSCMLNFGQDTVYTANYRHCVHGVLGIKRLRLYEFAP